MAHSKDRTEPANRYPFLTLHIGEISTDTDPEVYVRRHLNLLFSLPGEEDAPLTDRSLATLEERPQLSAEQQQGADARIACGLHQIDLLDPLGDGEVEIDTLPSYLLEPWSAFAAGTAVFRRRTNRATLYYIFPRAKVQGGDIVVDESDMADSAKADPSEPCYPSRTFPASDPMAMPVTDEEAARKYYLLTFQLLGYLPGGKIPGGLGAAIIKAVWPQGDSTLWEKIFKKVKDLAEEAAFEQAKSTLKSIVKLVLKDYLPAKDLGDGRAKLFSMIYPKITATSTAVDTLSAEAISQRGIEARCYGVNLLLTLYQEAALVDPATHARVDARSSSFVTNSIPATARAQAPSALEALDAVKAHRDGCISGLIVYTVASSKDPKGGYQAPRGFYYIDDFVGFKSATWCHKETASIQEVEKRRQAAQRSLDQYRRDQNAAYAAKLQELVGMTENWRRLAKNPLPNYRVPTTAPLFDEKQWIENAPVAGSEKWVANYKVRYRVSFVIAAEESEKGPWWSPQGADSEGWMGSTFAMPTLTDVPLDLSTKASARRIYRQFKGFDEELVNTLEDNTTTRVADSKP